jgi:hypothetical protein
MLGDSDPFPSAIGHFAFVLFAGNGLGIHAINLGWSG